MSGASSSSSSSCVVATDPLLPGSEVFRMSDAVLLVDCITPYLHSQGPKPQAIIDWTFISRKMSPSNSKRLTWTAEYCCMLWKFLAYGMWIKTEAVLSYDSDEEDCYFSPEHAEFKFQQNQVVSNDEKPIGFQREIPRKLLVPEVFRESSSKLLPHSYSNVLTYSDKSCQELNRFKVAEGLNYRSWALYKNSPGLFAIDHGHKKRKSDDAHKSKKQPKLTSSSSSGVVPSINSDLSTSVPTSMAPSSAKLSLDKKKKPMTVMPNNVAILSSKSEVVAATSSAVPVLVSASDTGSSQPSTEQVLHSPSVQVQHVVPVSVAIPPHDSTAPVISVASVDQTQPGNTEEIIDIEQDDAEEERDEDEDDNGDEAVTPHDQQPMLPLSSDKQ